MKQTDVVIVGGGQAGLAMSRGLTGHGIDHVVLERGRIAERWRSERWDSLRLLTPNWQSRLPGSRYRGPDPDGFMTMPEVVHHFEHCARSFDERGELRHRCGITSAPGLYVLGLFFLRRRNSSFIDGVGADALELSRHIEMRLRGGRGAVA